MKTFWLLTALPFLLFSNPTFAQEDPPEIQVGERLFRETRFAQFFFARFANAYNVPLITGDPALENLLTPNGLVTHPYRGQTMSCAGCHFVDQAAGHVPHGVRLYSDFAPRTPFTDRQDGATATLRNSSQMVGSSLRAQQPLHWDGEFFDAANLVRASLVGRNMGWLASETRMAKQHVANVIREDNGHFPNDVDLEGSYRELLRNLPHAYAIDVQLASDDQIFESVVKLIAEYMRSLDFSRTSAFDKFIELNGLPAKPHEGETIVSFRTRLLAALQENRSWNWVTPQNLKYHARPSQFTEIELEGFRIFAGSAQCIQCHVPPDFTDSGFHNVGVSQSEYESLHGVGSFAKINVPTARARYENYELYFEREIFRRTPRPTDPSAVDLGAWNILFNPNMPGVQVPLRESICRSLSLNCNLMTDEEILHRSVALFKTPSLRSVGQSGPYFHNGSAPDLLSVTAHYMRESVRATRAGRATTVNIDPIIKSMRLKGRDLLPLERFLESLNEDYD